MFSRMSAPGGSPGPGRPPRSPTGIPRTPVGQIPRVRRNVANLTRGIRLPPPSTMAIHGFRGPRTGLMPSARRILNLDALADEVGTGAGAGGPQMGPAIEPLAIEPAAAAPLPMNMNETPPRALPPYSAQLAQALGAPRRPPPPSRLAPPPPFPFSPSPPPPNSARTPNRSSRARRSRRSRKQSKKQARKRHTRRRR